MSHFRSKLFAARSRAGDVDYRLLAPLVLQAILVQTIYAIVRVTTSYRAIELHLPVVWLGVISAVFALPSLLLAVRIGRLLDRGYDAYAAWIGAAVFVLACGSFWLFANTLTALLLLTALFGTGHLFVIASQQMLCVRCSGPKSRDAVFGNYVVGNAIGQGLGPYVVAWLGGSATLPATGTLFGVALLFAIGSLAVAAAIRPAPKSTRPAAPREVVAVHKLLRQKGLLVALIASIVAVASQDLLTIYLPLFGAEQNIDVRDIGGLLTVRSIASLLSRLVYTRVLTFLGRRPLTLVSMVGAGLGCACFVFPIPRAGMYAAMSFLGFALGIATTLSLTNIVDLASAEAVGTVMSLRIIGNRFGQAVMPFVASLVAAAAGVAGIFAIIAASLVASGLSIRGGRSQS